MADYGRGVTTGVGILTAGGAAALVMRRPISNFVQSFDLIYNMRAKLGVEKFQALQQAFSATGVPNGIADLRNTFSLRHQESLHSIFSNKAGLQAFSNVLSTPQLKGIVNGILSIQPDGIVLIQNILANPQSLAVLKGFTSTPGSLNLLNTILGHEQGVTLLHGLFSGAKTVDGIGAALGLSSESLNVLQTMFSAHNIRVLKVVFPDEKSLLVLKDILANSGELEAFQKILSATGGDLQNLKNVLNAQALQAKPPMQSLGLFATAITLSAIATVLFVGLAIYLNQKSNKLEKQEQIKQKSYTVGSYVTTALAVGSIIALTTSIVLCVMHAKQYDIFSSSLMKSGDVMMNLAIVGLIGVTVLCMIIGSVCCAEPSTNMKGTSEEEIDQSSAQQSVAHSITS